MQWDPKNKPIDQSYTDWYRPRWDCPFDSPERLQDPLWRINNLYPQIDADGNRFRFVMREGMFKAYARQWWKNVFLKARQYGITTWICVLTLDETLFTRDRRSAIVAHNKDDAEIFFRDKILFGYENIGRFPTEYTNEAGYRMQVEPHGGLSFDEWEIIGDNIRMMVGKVKQTTSELYFTNHSSVRVTTSGRSSTLQRAHVSELGKIAAKFPDKAEEIKTGTIPATKRGVLWIESTAEGQEGFFKEICEKSMLLDLQGRILTREDYRFHFHPWWDDPDYTMDPTNVLVPDRLKKYFKDLEVKHDVPTLSDAQKAWYTKAEATFAEAMWREYPSYPKEAFKASLEGAFYASQMKRARNDGRVGDFPVLDGVPVDTYWDIGLDEICVWFVQRQGMWFNHVDFWHANNMEFHVAIKILPEKKEEFEWGYGTHYGPHDIRTRGGIVSKKSAWDIALDARIRFKQAKKVTDIDDAVRAVQRHLQLCRFDEENTLHGVSALESYRQKWDPQLGKFTGEPVHNWASHPASAMAVEALEAQPAQANAASSSQKPRRRRAAAYA